MPGVLARAAGHLHTRSAFPLPMHTTPGVLQGVIGGRYTVGSELGRGGMAIVYLASDSQGNEPVAIKVLRPELIESLARDRFLREIRNTDKLRHPSIVPL